MKVYISPTAAQCRDDNGVGKVVLAQHQYLPDLGIDLVADPHDADVINAHITDEGLPRVDVLSVHGLYWTGDPGSGRYAQWHHTANQKIIAAARRATLITVPSKWVSECFKRDMRISPQVIGHGIDLAEWEPAAKHRGYILWNKNRATDVCDPTPALELARRGYQVVTTFAPIGIPAHELPETLHVLGRTVPHERMRELIRHAEIYLATTKETFGIGTLEALACGVPVVGYDWGGTADLIDEWAGDMRQFLVKPGDIDALVEAIKWAKCYTRSHLQQNAQAIARGHSWEAVMLRYADLYRQVAAQRQAEQANSRPRVSVVITNYNYDKYVSRAIQSAVDQTIEPEIIVVDDGSTDGSVAVIQDQFIGAGDTIVQLIEQQNQGVAAARNAGIAAAHGEYIICLDADDELSEHYIETLLPVMDRTPDLGVAYTGLALLGDDRQLTPNAWPPQFDWQAQTQVTTPPSNCIPCAAMFRKDMWERAGGYKQVYAPAEDAEFWVRGLSIGYRAERVTDAALFHYRNHPVSASKTKTYKPIDMWHPWMRDNKYPMAAPAKQQPLVKSYSEPLVSVVIPVGPGHAHYLPAALDSLLGQTFRDWEVIVVDDTGPEGIAADLLEPYPFALLLETRPYHDQNAGPFGAGVARNVGLEYVKTPLVLFLDADDWLQPTALETMLQAYVASKGKYVYSDWFSVEEDSVELRRVPDYTRMGWLETGLHAVTALLPIDKVREIGGFDETLVGWEDWDFYIKLTIAGVCGVRVPEPLLSYRRYSGTWRRLALQAKDEKRNQLLNERYGAYVTGDKPMPGCCGGNGDAILQAQRALQGPTGLEAEAAAVVPVDGVVRMEYIGQNVGAITFFGQRAGREYRGGNNPFDRYINADPADVAKLVGSGRWRIVQQQLAVAQTTTFDAVLQREPSEPNFHPVQDAPNPVRPVLMTVDEPPVWLPDPSEQAAIDAANAEVTKQTKRGRPARS